MIPVSVDKLEDFHNELLVIYVKLSHQNKINCIETEKACNTILDIRRIVRSIIVDEIKKIERG